ncbi:MAG TPA: SMP-30/gluconolactonase/LRE family protein, partial [Pyrinomonadaceae bacterium]|nr:SMP-30/gluconolactonase/LRE family protein [Pyrinomonadaceae bacterium]
FSNVRTLAGADANSIRFGDPFGVACSQDGAIYVSDGEAGRIWQIAKDGSVKSIAENLNTPSAIAPAPDGTLIVADTGSHTIKRVVPQTGSVTVIAGVEGRAGFKDGRGAETLFNGPIGVAVNPDGTIFVADTYNDRIRAIDKQGEVRTIAGGGEPGFADASKGADARFDTPCGVALDVDGTLIVADAGNNRLRRVALDGAVTTIAGTGVRSSQDGTLQYASFNEPTAVAVDEEGTIYVADAGGSDIRVCSLGLWPRVTTLAGVADSGLLDGELNRARLNNPYGIAISTDGTLIIADTGNRLVRAVVRKGDARGVELMHEAAEALRPKASDFRKQAPPRWPYDPPDRPREIAATFGEVRGEVGDGHDAWFHNGLDIPGAYGETARVVRSEKILRPLSVDDVGGVRERIRFPTMGYIHLRIGRDLDDKPFADDRFILRRDAKGKVTAVRVRRGTHFSAGDAIGTLNNQNHVHLIAGPTGSEFNALAALELPGVKDTVAPVIEKDGVRLFDKDWREFAQPSSAKDSKQATGNPLIVHGDVRVIVRAYDQMDGNATRRRLGLYQLGYQVLNGDGTPAQGFAEPRWTISFESLPDDARAAPLAYAQGSKANATGETIFAYIVTNIVRDRAAKEDFWHTSELPEGDYLLRVFAADYFGNKTTRDVAVKIKRDF